MLTRLEKPPPSTVLARRSGTWSAAVAAMPAPPRRMVDCTLPGLAEREN
jgi:hypothetical protein